jgi:hypothetical protein
LRAALEDERQTTADKYARLDIDFAQREAERQRSFESQLAQVIRDFSAESERLLRTVNDRVIAARLKKETDARASELRRSAGVRLRKQIETAPVPAAHAASVVLKAPAQPIDEIQFDAGEINERDQRGSKRWIRKAPLNQLTAVSSRCLSDRCVFEPAR